MNNENHKVLDFNKFKKKKKAEMKKQKKSSKLKTIKTFLKEMFKALDEFPIRLLILADILILFINRQIEIQFICLTCAILICSISMAISETSKKSDKDIII